MAGEPSDMRALSYAPLPHGYWYEETNTRRVVRCLMCGHRWYADRMQHHANYVFLEEHMARHKVKPRWRLDCPCTIVRLSEGDELRCVMCGVTHGVLDN